MPPSQTEVQQIAPSSSSTSPATVSPTVDTPSLLQSADYDTAAPVMATTSSTAATPAAVDDASASSDCNAAVDSSSLTADDEREEQETIIVFDWDDTLLSSSWLAGLGYRLDSNMVSAPASLFAALETLAAAVCELLRLAAQHGRVVVITNAETGWVELSAQKFIPSVVPVLNELAINIFSARSTYEPLHPDLPLKWKSCAFEHVLSEPSALQLQFLSKTISKNVLSLGDSHVEREAVRLVTAEMANTLCKSVKFAERPTCEQLTRQLTLVTNCFSYILNHQNHLDLQLTVTVSEQNQQQAKEEEEKMRCQEQSAMTAHDDGCGGFVPTNNPSSLCMDEEEDEEKVLEAF